MYVYMCVFLCCCVPMRAGVYRVQKRINWIPCWCNERKLKATDPGCQKPNSDSLWEHCAIVYPKPSFQLLGGYILTLAIATVAWVAAQPPLHPLLPLFPSPHMSSHPRKLQSKHLRHPLMLWGLINLLKGFFSQILSWLWQTYSSTYILGLK